MQDKQCSKLKNFVSLIKKKVKKEIIIFIISTLDFNEIRTYNFYNVKDFNNNQQIIVQRHVHLIIVIVYIVQIVVIVIQFKQLPSRTCPLDNWQYIQYTKLFSTFHLLPQVSLSTFFQDWTKVEYKLLFQSPPPKGIRRNIKQALPRPETVDIIPSQQYQ